MGHFMRSVRTASLVALLVFAGAAQALEPGQNPPLRIYSIGDSLTRAANANLPGDNLNNSWVNGYHGFWQRLFGLPDVSSHNQRITAQFGEDGRRNFTAARNGSRVDDMLAQSGPLAELGIDYATVFLGGQDVCRDDPANLPTDVEFEANVRGGLTAVVQGVRDGATVLVVAIPNLKALHDLGQDKSALGIASCPTLWRITDFCEAMLARRHTELDREYVQSRNVGYNRILELVTQEVAASFPGKFVRYSAGGYQVPAELSHISDIDCFHASYQGQRTLAELTWPFAPSE